MNLWGWAERLPKRPQNQHPCTHQLRLFYTSFFSTGTSSNTMKLGRKQKKKKDEGKKTLQKKKWADHKVDTVFVILFYIFNTSRFIG